MRTTILALLAIPLLGFGSVPALAQDAGRYREAPKGGANFDLEDAPLSSTLDLIRDWAHVEFAIDPADMDHTVTMNLRNPTVQQALDAIFLPIGLQYEIDGQRVTVSRR
jgi:type II secretory pathway component GspD/PulD (secretin)